MADAAAILEDVRVGSRDERRFAVGSIAHATYAGKPLIVFIKDISESGMRVATQDEVLRCKDLLTVELPMLEEQLVEVIWVERRTAGVRFSDRLGGPVLSIVAAAMQPAEFALTRK